MLHLIMAIKREAEFKIYLFDIYIENFETRTELCIICPNLISV